MYIMFSFRCGRKTPINKKKYKNKVYRDSEPQYNMGRQMGHLLLRCTCMLSCTTCPRMAYIFVWVQQNFDKPYRVGSVDPTHLQALRWNSNRGLKKWKEGLTWDMLLSGPRVTCRAASQLVTAFRPRCRVLSIKTSAPFRKPCFNSWPTCQKQNC